MTKRRTLLLVVCLAFSNINYLFNFSTAEVSAEEVKVIEEKNDNNNSNWADNVVEKESTTETIDSWLPDKNLQQALLEVMKILEDGDTGQPILPENATVDDITKELAQQIYQSSYDQDFGLLKNRKIKDLTGLIFFEGLFYEGGDLSNNDIETLDPITEFESKIGEKGQMNFDNNHLVDLSKGNIINISSALNQTKNYGEIIVTDSNYRFDNPLKTIEGPITADNIVSIQVDGINKGELVENENIFQFNDLTYGKHLVKIKWSDELIESRSYPWFSGELSFVLNYVSPFVSNVTVHYQDVTGKKLIDDKVLSGNIGDNYQSEQLTFNGYTFKEVLGDTAGKFSDTAQEVTYVYELSDGATVTLKYVDADGKSIAKEETLTGKIGSNYEAQAKQIEDYTLKETPTNASGTFTEKEQVVTFKYGKINSNQPIVPPTNMDKQNTGSSSKPKHNKDTSILPQTGEHQSVPYLMVIGILLLGSSAILLRRWKRV